MQVRDVILEAGRLGILLDPRAADLLSTVEAPFELMRSYAAAPQREAILTYDLIAGFGRPPADRPSAPAYGAPSGVVTQLVGGRELRVQVPASGTLWRSEILPGVPAIPALAPLARPAAVAAAPIPQREEAARLARRIGTFEPVVQVLDDITGNSTCEGSMSDFRSYFQYRFGKLKKFLTARPDLAGCMPISRVSQMATNEVRFIGMVTEVRKTKNGHTMIEVEDETGTADILALAREDRHVIASEGIMQDEVVGIVGKRSRPRDGRPSDLIILEEIVRPDIPMTREPRRARADASVAFISDIHFGSKTFLGAEWDRFVSWMNLEVGTADQKQAARGVKYLVAVGDIVDGIGVYPGQDKNLSIEDIGQQYKEAARQLAKLPEDVCIIVLPGNHDAVRPAEPQPGFAEKYRAGFSKNVRFVGNPCRLSIEGVEILAYHGVSIIDFITAIPGLDPREPSQAMREMLKRRHIAPMYGGKTPVAPEQKDHLLIEHVPDIFVTGHMHYSGVDEYRGTTLVNSSCWQSRTDYQKMLGIEPEPARVPIVDLRTGESTILNFSDERTRRDP